MGPRARHDQTSHGTNRAVQRRGTNCCRSVARHKKHRDPLLVGLGLVEPTDAGVAHGMPRYPGFSPHATDAPGNSEGSHALADRNTHRTALRRPVPRRRPPSRVTKRALPNDAPARTRGARGGPGGYTRTIRSDSWKSTGCCRWDCQRSTSRVSLYSHPPASFAGQDRLARSRRSS